MYKISRAKRSSQFFARLKRTSRNTFLQMYKHFPRACCTSRECLSIICILSIEVAACWIALWMASMLVHSRVSWRHRATSTLHTPHILPAYALWIITRITNNRRQVGSKIANTIVVRRGDDCSLGGTPIRAAICGPVVRSCSLNIYTKVVAVTSQRETWRSDPPLQVLSPNEQSRLNFARVLFHES